MGKLLEMHNNLAADVGSTIAPRVPIVPRDPDVPVVRTNRWIRTRDDVLDVEKLVKEYEFIDAATKVQFIASLSSYEEQIQHHANVYIEFQESKPQFRVRLELWTRNINQVTELDKEYARFADTLYRELVYNVQHAW